MNCRAKTQSGLVVLFILVFSGLASARELEWTELSSTLIEIQPFASHQGEVLSSYVPVIPTLMKGFLSWDPHKELNISTQNKDWREPSSKTSELIEDISAQFDVENAQFPHFFKGMNLGVLEGHHLVGSRSSLYDQEALMKAHLIFLRYKKLV